MTVLCCPTCGRVFHPDQTPAMPFCSERCRLIDLGRWLNEEQGLPYEPSDDETLPVDESLPVDEARPAPPRISSRGS